MSFLTGIGGKIALGLTGLIALAGIAWAIIHNLEQAGAAKVEAADSKAVVVQQQKDATLNTAIVAKVTADTAKTEATATAAKEAISALPTAPATDPALLNAADSVRGLLASYPGGAHP